MIDAYKYDRETGEYLGRRRIARRRKSHSEPNEPLIIGPYTTTAPPAKSERRRALVWNKTTRAWSEVADFRGVRAWSRASGEPVELKLGEEPGDDVTLEKPGASLSGEQSGVVRS